jgi:uncharacterized Zn finger protein
MKEKLTCPNCYSYSIKKRTGKGAKEPSRVTYGDPEKENIIYECLSCGKVFDEHNLLNIEMEN